MKKLVLIGRSEAGKTTLTQALRGEKIHYHKTQYVNNFDVIVDTPGEYAQTQGVGHALDFWYQLSSRTACFPHASPAWPTAR